VALALGCGSSFAQRWQSEVSVSSELSATTNSQLGVANAQSDLVGSVQPRVSLLSDGPQFKFSATASANAVSYANGTRDSKVYPAADIGLTLVPVERFFFLDAGVRVSQAFVDPFASTVNSGASVSANTVNTTQVRLSPTIDFTLLPLNVRTQLRSDNVRLYDDADRSAGTAAPTGNFAKHTAVIESLSRPLSWSLQGDRSETRYRDAGVAPQIIDNARLTVDYWVNDQLSFGLRGGAERNNFIGDNEISHVRGGQFTWRPSERTDLTAFGEKRFFGTGWRLDFTHRMPWLSWTVGFKRDIATTPQELFQLPATGDVAGLLDALLTTRFPDPFERARQVQDLINRTGLPPSLLTPAIIYAQRLSLSTSASAGVVYTGVRNSIALSVFHGKLQDVPGAGALVTGAILNNNVQRGASLALTHRMSPTIALSAIASWSDLHTLAGLPVDQSSEQRDLRLTVLRQLSPRTNLRLGAVHAQLIQNRSSSERATSVLAGIDHRF
jgi:uncharacterized protein (PEP-CTERM system associated)